MPSNQRPRDLLGRPLPWDARTQLELEDFDAFDPDRNHALGIEHFNGGRFFSAHEAWETAWKQLRDTDDAEFFKGLAQMGAGYVHLLRGNPHGVVVLLERATSRLRRYGERHRGLDLAAVVDRCERDRRDVLAGALAPGPEALTLDPPFLQVTGV